MAEPPFLLELRPRTRGSRLQHGAYAGPVSEREGIFLPEVARREEESSARG